MITLRPFQNDAIDDLTTSAANGKRRLLLQAATGAGKTVIASRIIQHSTGNEMRVLFLAHRRELVYQCRQKLEMFEVPCGIILSGDPWDASRLVNVASIQTLHSWAIRRKRVGFPKADIVVIDEAHHYNSSKTWQDVVGAYPEAILLGMTATPINRRGKGLGHFFDEMIRCPSIRELTEQGYLVRARYFCPNPIDLSGIKVQAGDYVEGELERKMDNPKLIGDICTNWSRFANQRQTLVFASGVKHSIHIAEEFNKLGVSAAHVDAHTEKEERDRIVREFTDGKIKVLCNCAIFTEGTDIPSASCLVFARPTKSLLLYLQVAGRVLRTFPGKDNAIILDHAGVCYEHGQIDQDWDWKLDYGDGDVRRETRKKTKLKKEITCGECKAVYWGKLACPECGWKPKIKGKPVETYEGYLQALDELEHPKLDERMWYQMLSGYAMAHGKKPGLAYYKFLEKFGHKPPWSWKHLEPIEPSLEVNSWVRSQNIRYAMRRKKEDQSTSAGPSNTMIDGDEIFA